MGKYDQCRHGEPEGHCATCAACTACKGECGTCPYAPMTPAVPDPTVEARARVQAYLDTCLFPSERDRNFDVGSDDDCPLWSDDLRTLLTARAAAPDALRVAVEALAAEWERTDWNATPHLGCLDMYRHCGGLLRALLDDPALAGRATGGEG